MTATRSIHLRYFAILREQRGLGDETVPTSASTPEELYRELAAQYRFTLSPERIRAAVNDQFVAMDALLSDGDTVVFVPPVAGG